MNSHFSGFPVRVGNLNIIFPQLRLRAVINVAKSVLTNKPAVDVAAISVHLQEPAAGDFLEVVANLMER